MAARHPDTGLSVGAQKQDFAAWLHISNATLTFPQTLVLRDTHFAPLERLQPQVTPDEARWFLARLRAGRFTAADVAVLAAHLALASQWSPSG